MARKLLLIDGHPDPDPGRLIHALTEAYARGAEGAGHEVRQIRVAELDFPLIRTGRAFLEEAPPPDIAAAQTDIAWAEHLIIFYPLWLGTLPALLKGFFEQALRPGFAFDPERGPFDPKLEGRTARIVVTMEMPALVYRWFYRAHSLKSLERNILKLCGIKTVGETLLGGLETTSDATRQGWLVKLETLGRRGG